MIYTFDSKKSTNLLLILSASKYDDAREYFFKIITTTDKDSVKCSKDFLDKLSEMLDKSSIWRVSEAFPGYKYVKPGSTTVELTHRVMKKYGSRSKINILQSLATIACTEVYANPEYTVGAFKLLLVIDEVRKNSTKDFAYTRPGCDGAWFNLTITNEEEYREFLTDILNS